MLRTVKTMLQCATGALVYTTLLCVDQTPVTSVSLTYTANDSLVRVR